MTMINGKSDTEFPTQIQEMGTTDFLLPPFCYLCLFLFPSEYNVAATYGRHLKQKSGLHI